ncbi:MAG: peptidoglycan DD-metalloendopeptidase family protein [Xanthomonadales bacterium]|nr:peptidoglycan DD-metalloendopeptidase family protein [Xanthomonadales bacterium]
MAAALCLAMAAGAQAPSGEADEAALRQQLERLRQDLGAIKAELRQAQGNSDQLSRDLESLDRRVASSAGEVEQAQAAVEQVELDIASLESEQQAIERQLLAQRDQIRLLLRSAYAAGQWAPLKLWLDQARFADATRALGYHQYLKERQLQSLQALQALAVRQQAVAQSLLDKRAEALAAVETLAGRQLALESERAERAEHLAAAMGRLRGSEENLRALQKDESALLQLIEQVSNRIADIPRRLPQAESLARQRGRLPWPVQGTVRQRFGSRGGDGRALQGIRIAADEGTPIRAVGHGRVAFADWLRGHGLLLIIDHGEGYMSLYANCETLTLSEGDWVNGGDPIGTVGRSGGLADSGLHFELRQGRKAIDPLPWLIRRQ